MAAWHTLQTLGQPLLRQTRSLPLQMAATNRAHHALGRHRHPCPTGTGRRALHGRYFHQTDLALHYPGTQAFPIVFHHEPAF